MKINKRLLAVCIAVPLAVGGLAAWLTRNGMETFQHLRQPPLSPPGWLFAVVWSLLYTLMGIASYLVLTSDETQLRQKRALWTYGAQLAMNFLWSILFFNLELFGFALFWLAALWLVILAAFVQFFSIRRSAGWLLLPYLAWVTFAIYLNFGIWRLN